MSQVSVQQVEVKRLTQKIRVLEKKVSLLRDVVEDSLVTADEAKTLNEIFAKLERGDRSDFVAFVPRRL